MKHLIKFVKTFTFYISMIAYFVGLGFTWGNLDTEGKVIFWLLSIISSGLAFAKAMPTSKDEIWGLAKIGSAIGAVFPYLPVLVAICAKFDLIPER